MRKLTALGLGALASLTLALGPASSASAVVVPPGSVTQQVCNAVPGALNGVLGQLSNLGIELGQLNSDLSEAETDLSDAINALVDAIVTHVWTVDNGGNVDATAAIVNARMSEYADAAAAWSQLVSDVFLAEMATLAYDMQNDILLGLQGGLCVI